MTAADFLLRLRDLGIKIWADGDRLRLSAPKDAVTSELRAELKDRKEELLRFLGQRSAAAEGGADVQIERVSREGPIPLSDTQQRLWLLHELGEELVAYNVPLNLRIRGSLNREALDWALGQILERHEAMRTSFAVVDDQPTQVIAPAEPLALPVTDLRGTPDAEREALRFAAEHIGVVFALTQGPLYSLRLLQIDEHDHLLSVVLSHIIADGWSFGVLQRELAQLYEARTLEQPSPLAPLDVQYVDYSAWRHQWYEWEAPNLLGYWKKHLAGAPTLSLPTDRPRPAQQTFVGRKREFWIPKDLATAVQALGRKEGCTFFMTMLAAFKVLLARYAGQDDISVGTAVANRDLPQAQPLIGFFMNTLVVRTRLGGDPGFRECLRRVRETALGAYQHQGMPFERLVQELNPERDLSRNPLFQVAFVLDEEAPAFSFAGLDVEQIELEHKSAKFDLTFALRETGDGLSGDVEFNVDLFDEATIARMQEHLLVLLQGMVADPDGSIWTLPLRTEAERAQIDEVNAPRAAAAPATAAPCCVHELVAKRAETAPETLALAAEGGAQWSYAELDQFANRVANVLRDKGVGPSVLVGVLMERVPEMVGALLGVMKAGGAYVPLDPANPAERQALMIADAQMPVLLTQEHLATVLGETRVELLCLDRDRAMFEAAPATAPPGGREPGAAGTDDLAYVIFTSGSTGRPKGVEIQHRALLNLIAWHCAEYHVTPADRATSLAGLAFDASVWEIWPYLTTGASLHLPREETRSAPSRLLAWLAEVGVTLSFAPTPLAEAMLAENMPEGLELRALLTGGDKLHAPPPAGLPFELVNHYGPTENAVVATFVRIAPGSRVPPPIGGPIRNVEVQVLDAHLQPCPIGIPGELCIGGASLARGYYGRSDLTAEKFIPHPFGDGRLYRTGDSVRWQADGQLEFLGRIDQQVKIRGFRIELGEIEHALADHASVKECAVVAQQRGSDRQLVGFVVPRPGAMLDVAALRDHLAAKLPEYMVPAAVAELAELPLTANGKVDRQTLAARDVQGSVSRTSSLPPRTPVERRVADVWREILGLEAVGREDNFFELGGHSLHVVQLRRKLQSAFGEDLSVSEVFQYPTVAALASRLGDDPEPALPSRSRAAVARPAAGAEPSTDAIAIVGMAGRFPRANDLEQFWVNLRDGLDCVTFFDEDEVRRTGMVGPAQLGDPAYVRARAILDDVDRFDAGFFGFNPREAASSDPQMRLFLETAWQSLEDAGYHPAACPGAVGVWAGSGPNTYHRNNLVTNAKFAGGADAFDMSLVDATFLTTRISYKLNLKGPSVEVYTACSTSLVATVQACHALLAGQCDMALAGGVFVGVPQRVGHLYREGEIFSPDGHCRPFDIAARGTFSGEGVGVVVLKRLADAQADGDHIRAVIRGAAMNNDGSNKVGFTAPSVEGQAEVIASAHALADVDPDEIDYIECHGTATPLGDPIEVAALTRAFRARTDRTGYCALGSVKSNIGHADTAAGVAGLIKAVLALEHEQIPPSLYFDEPNPDIDFARSPFFVNGALRPWPRGERPRRAGVSSFGIGGTNAHVLLEEGPAAEPSPGRPQQLLVLSAKSESALDAATADLAGHLKAHPEIGLADVAFTLQASRSAFVHRRFLVASDIADAATIWADDAVARRAETALQRAEDPPVVFMFPGQGAQHVGMGRELFETEPVFRAEVERCAELLRPQLGLDLCEILYPATPTEEHDAQLRQTRITQPALFVVEYALAQLWMSWGVLPDAMIGHSVGEYVAACLAGVFSVEEALRLVAKRASLMQELPEGGMLSVGLPEAEVMGLLNGELSLSAVNGPSSCVVSGPSPAVEALQEQLAEQDLPCRLLHTSHAFHSTMMEPIVEPFAAVVAEVQLAPAALPCVSTVTGDWIEPGDWARPDYWAKNLRHPVRFSDAAKALLDKDEHVFLEVGPGQTLSALVRQQGKPAKGRTVLPSMRHPQEALSDRALLLRSVGRLWLAGVRLDWPALHRGEMHRRVPLPTYPFERQRYWIEGSPGVAAGPAGSDLSRKPNVADWFWQASWQSVAAPPGVAAETLSGGLLFAGDDALSRGLQEQLRPDVVVRAGSGYREVSPGVFELRPGAREDYDQLVAALRQRGAFPDRVVHLWGVRDRRADDGLAHREEIEARGFYSLLHLAQALQAHEIDQELRLEVVVNDLHAVLGDEAFAPARAAALGPCRVIPAELEQIQCRVIDVSTAGLGEVGARQVRCELAAPPIPVVAYRGPRRWVPAFAPVPLAEAAPPLWLRPGGVFLITGGLGGVGHAIAQRLATVAGTKMVLTSRGGLPEPAAWQAWLSEHGAEHRTSRRIQRLQDLRAAGAEVALEVADVGDLEAMRGVLARTAQRFGPIRGVIHAAGLATGGLIAARAAAGAAEVLAPKVAGTLVLDALLRDEPLELFALCSSVTSVKGGVGSVDYTGANAFLDAFAHAAQDRPWPVVTINWDAWREAGMAAEADVPEEMREAHQEVLAKGLSDQEGAEVFLRAASSGLPQVLVSTFDLPARLAADEAPEPELEAKSDDGDHARPEVATEFVAPTGALEEAIADTVRSLLGIDRIGRDDDFFDLGFDSLIGHRLIARLKQKHRVSLPLRAVLETPNVAALAAQAAGAAPPSTPVASSPAAPAAPPAPAPVATPPQPVHHPLFDERWVEADGQAVWQTQLRPEAHWALGEHRMNGAPVLVGTAYLELARAAFEQLAAADLAGGKAIELREVYFLSPLTVADGETRKVRTVLTPEGDAMRFVVESQGPDGGEWGEHATGELRVAASEVPRRDVAALRAECDVDELAVDADDLERRTGPMQQSRRWAGARHVRFGRDRQLVDIELEAQFAADVGQMGLHPALLDTAIGYREATPSGMLPFAYDRVVVRSALSAQLHSLIVERVDPPDGERVYDVSVMDPHGTELVSIEGYRTRRVAAATPAAGPAGENATLKITELGLIEELRYVATPRVPPRAGEIEIEVAASALNFKDVLFTLGLMPSSEGGVPDLGLECAGRVARVGDGVTEFAPGDEVVALASSCFARFVTTEARTAAPVPKGMSMAEAATVPISYLTAYHSLVVLGRLQRGESCLIHAAAGGVGLAAVHVCRWLGAEVYATAGSDPKRDYLRSLGIEHVMDSRSLAFAEEVMQRSGGRGVDVVLNSLAGEYIPKGLSILAPYGRFLELGAQDIFANTPLGLAPFQKSLAFHAVMVGPGMPTFADSWRELGALLARRELPALPHEVFAAAEAVRAFEFLAAAKHIGRVVVSFEGADDSLVERR
ncbi:MAG: amino acid adenylation domain-containing protein [Planctomycetota bacterium]